MNYKDGVARTWLRFPPRARGPVEVDPTPCGSSRWWWGVPLLIYIATRLVNVGMMMIAASHQMPIDQFRRHGGMYFTTTAGTAPAGFLTVASNWDGQWYWEIAANGYPSHLPTDGAGRVLQNPWAFFPLYPYVVRGFMWATGLGFPLAASLVSVTFGALATLLLFRLVALKSDELGARLAVLGLCTFTCAPVFLIAYTEGLALSLVIGILLALSYKRYGLVAALLLLLSLSRGVTAAMAGLFVVLAVINWIHRRRSPANILPYIVLAAWSGILTVLWPFIAAMVTGNSKAYFLTQNSWNSELATIPVVRFVDRISDLVGGPWLAWPIAVAWALLLLWVVTLKQASPIVRAWSAVYVAYVLLIVDWNPSALRYYLLALPIFWPLTQASMGDRRNRVWLAAVLGTAGIVTQWWWIRYAVVVSPEVVQVP